MPFKSVNMMSHRPFTRRSFVKALGLAGLAAPFVTRDMLAKPPNSVLHHASFGAAGMAWEDIKEIAKLKQVEIIAVAEVDLRRTEAFKKQFPHARIYQDWRELLDQEGKQLDSVNVSTPDHMHAPIAMSALQLGKHVYCQKPLTHDLYEARKLTEFARFKGVVTQMGIQIHSSSFYRVAALLVQAGAIGKVKEVHSWVGSCLGRPDAAAGNVRSGAGGLRLGPLAGCLRTAAFHQQGLLSPRRLAQAA